jgi:hypothetical protein
MENIIVSGINVPERFLNLRDWCLRNFPPMDVHPKIVRCIVALTDAVPAYKVYLNVAKISSIAGQISVQKNDGFAFCGARIGIRKSATAAAVKDQLTYTYADKAIFDALGELASVQGFYSAGEVGLMVEGRPAMQPLALSWFEDEADPVNGATTGPVYGRHLNKFVPMYMDRIISGDSDNYFDFNLSGDVAVIGDAGTNYLIVELVGFQLHTQGEQANRMAKDQNGCIIP